MYSGECPAVIVEADRKPASLFSCTPCMNDSLEVQVLFTSRWGEVIAKRKGVIAR